MSQADPVRGAAREILADHAHHVAASSSWIEGLRPLNAILDALENATPLQVPERFCELLRFIREHELQPGVGLLAKQPDASIPSHGPITHKRLDKEGYTTVASVALLLASADSSDASEQVQFDAMMVSIRADLREARRLQQRVVTAGPRLVELYAFKLADPVKNAVWFDMLSRRLSDPIQKLKDAALNSSLHAIGEAFSQRLHQELEETRGEPAGEPSVLPPPATSHQEPLDQEENAVFIAVGNGMGLNKIDNTLKKWRGWASTICDRIEVKRPDFVRPRVGRPRGKRKLVDPRKMDRFTADKINNDGE